MHISIFIMLFSALALGFAYTSEHIFGLLPCILCIYQRIPFFIVILLSLISLACHGKTRLVLVALCSIFILIDAGIAGYHLGVENGKFHVDGGCEAGDTKPTTIEEMRNELIGRAAAPCEKPQFVFLGISMAGWNFFFSSFIGGYTLILALRSLRDTKKT
jgi:disulfide bond formation protein DsbB